ncbi:MAG: glycosyltransferase family 4 protein [Deltaproteobacteria bacterium]|nr:glycosyltransferase family 4 protein [Deltaproteobacteria bacterium]
MRIAFLVQGVDAARTRYRILQYLPFFRDSEVDARVFDVPRGMWAKRRLFAAMDQYDVVLIQKRLFGDRDFALLREKANRLIFDVDDAVMEKLDDSFRKRKRRRSNFERTVKECDLVFAGNAYLEKIVHDLGAPAVRVPTCVDLARYPVRKEIPRAPEDFSIKIGWIGSRSNLPYLEALKPVFLELGQSGIPLELHIICDTFFDLEGLPVIKKIWGLDTEVHDLMELDIGLAPLPDNRWTRGKSATKIVQYMAAGMPVICSPVGANAEIVRDGVDGLHAETHQDWLNKLFYLLEYPEVRIRMGRAGRMRVEEFYSVQANFPILYGALMDLCGCER